MKSMRIERLDVDVAAARLSRGLCLLALLVGLVLASVGEGRAVELWQTWVARHDVTQVAEAETSVFVLADGALHAVSKQDQSIRLYDRSSGLSDVGISHIAWAAEVKKLIVVYRSGMIDLLSSQAVEAIPALREASHAPQKDVYDLVVRGRRAWLSGAYGVMQIDLDRALVEGTYLVNTPVRSVANIQDDRLMVVVDGELLEGRLADNLQDPSAWRERTDLGREWQQIAAHGEIIIGRQSGQAQRLTDGGLVSIVGLGVVDELYSLSDGIVLKSEGRLYRLEGDGARSFASVSAKALSGSLERGRIWLAKGGEGVAHLRKQEEGWQEQPIATQLDAPKSNNMYAMRYHRGRLYVVSGGRDKDRFRTPGVVQIFDGKRWESLTSREISPQTGIDFLDPVDIMPHRDGKPLHYYVATWGEGLYELDEGRVVARYDVGNSALVSAIPSSPHYTRVGSLCYDDKGNLWMAQGLTQDSGGGSVVRLSPSGQWRAYDYAPIRASNSFHTQIALPSGTKWLLDNHLSDHGEGVFVYNDRGTDDLSDDAYAHYSALRESNGKQINFSKITAMALDKKGALWLGANIGFFYVQSPSVLPRADKQPIAVRPVATNQEGSLYYVLDNVGVTAIVVDALNRKWLGTATGGLYLLSEDGLEVLRHYTMQTSPLLSNRILSLAIDEAGGQLFVGTPTGLNVLDTRTAVEGNEPTNQLVAYPNPLRPEYASLITIEGLTAGAVLEVSDASGRLVHRGEAVDSRYKWQPYGSDGRRLPSGVYTIIAHSRGQRLLGKLKITIITND